MAASTARKCLTSRRKLHSCFREGARGVAGACLQIARIPSCCISTPFYHHWIQAGPNFVCRDRSHLPTAEKVKAFLADSSALVAAAPAATAPAKVEAKEESDRI